MESKDQDGRANGDDQLASRRTLDDIKRIFVFPELERRRRACLPVPSELHSFQIIWLEGPQDAPSVRLNEEVRALLKVDATESDLRIGDAFRVDETSKVTAVHLLPEEESFAHFTTCSLGHLAFFSFDFRHQKRAARKNLAVAEEFLVTARMALEAGLHRSFLENAHSCVELSVKIGLLLLSRVGEGRIRHPEIRSRAQPFGHLDAARTLLESLANLRLPARYLVGELEVSGAQLVEAMRRLDQVVEEARSSVAAAGPSA